MGESNMDKRFSGGYQETQTGVYGNYTDPQPTGSIYLPLEKRSVEGNGYAHLEGSNKTAENEGQHTYETLHHKNTFKIQDNVYDNPGATIDEDKKDDSGSEHDYEVADASVSVRGPAYENPVPVKDKEDTSL
ncbi:hypothetical protein QZH41_016001 [Actinostola sp. cb2023]|nr:hypothetical protein QZH41_016001 [Actinostola sp. cb2023]